MGSVSSKKNVPCAACKLLRRRCKEECILLPHFPSGEVDKFAAVHRVFGASNVCKMLQEIPIDNREDAVTSMVYEAKARLMDPVYGSVAIIASLQTQVLHLQSELNVAVAETMALKNQLSEALLLLASFQACSSTKEGLPNTHQYYHPPAVEETEVVPASWDLFGNM